MSRRRDLLSGVLTRAAEAQDHLVRARDALSPPATDGDVVRARHAVVRAEAALRGVFAHLYRAAVEDYERSVVEVPLCAPRRDPRSEPPEPPDPEGERLADPHLEDTRPRSISPRAWNGGAE